MNNKPQDINRFRNAAYWNERFGDLPNGKSHFEWTPFYEAVANKLLEHKKDRKNRAELLKFTKSLSGKFGSYYHIYNQLDDICPFTTLGLFNRGISDGRRSAIAKEVADFLGVTDEVPDSFEGIPLLNNQQSRFFGSEEKRAPRDIQSLWDFFAKAIDFSDNDAGEARRRKAFTQAYDRVTEQYGVGWNITMALYWIRPWNFPTLDALSQLYIKKELEIDIAKNGAKKRSSAEDYLALRGQLNAQFQEDTYPVHSFPELSLAAWNYKDDDTSAQPDASYPDADAELTDKQTVSEASAVLEPYTIKNIMDEGCFLDRDSIEKILKQLRIKKNLILQGPPGTGKTWLAKKLAFALMGKKNNNALHAMQFHPNLSYEDFVRGYRPSGDGKLTLEDGPFLKMIDAAKKDAQIKYVMVIEEINRGNPAQIFGEMLTLLESDKRKPSEGLKLSYSRDDSERVHLPDNLYVIGTMNIADRSLAMMDLALRRRFAFYNLNPVFDERWRKWVHKNSRIKLDLLKQIGEKLTSLNSEIEKDRSLGPQFKIGHSYVTPHSNSNISDQVAWYKGVVESEIRPLLAEYWFDDPERADKACDELTKGF